MLNEFYLCTKLDVDKVAELLAEDKEVIVDDLIGGDRDAMVELLSKHHNYPADMDCPLYWFLVDWHEKEAVKERFPLVRKELVDKERKELFQELSKAHEVLCHALTEDDSEMRHDAILQVQVLLHGVLAGKK